MDSLIWSQESDGLHVSVPSQNGDNIGFLIGNTFINTLLAGTPPIYIVNVLYNGSEIEHTFMLDITKARPYIDKTNALKLNFNKRKISSAGISGTSVGRYSLSRGECYSERYFSSEGWQYHVIYNDIYPMSDIIASASAVMSASASNKQNSNPVAPQPVPKVDDDDDFDLDLT